MSERIQIVNVQVFNSYLRSFQARNVLIEAGLFRYIDEEIHPHDRLIDGGGHYMIPGLIDMHMHIESSMCTPSAFSSAALVHGTTTVLDDSHEIANVFGLAGVQSFIDNRTLLDIFYAIPSCVPSTNSELESTGGVIGPDEVRQLCENPRVLALGEVMNFNDTVSSEPTLIKEIIRVVREAEGGKIIEGHCSRSGLQDVSDFLFAGVSSCHTEMTLEGFYNKFSSGMFMQLQRKAITAELMELIHKHNFYEFMSFVTDDVMPDDLREGHLNAVLNLAIQCGMDPLDAIYCATLTPARRMHLEDRGAIAPGRVADFLFIAEPSEIKPLSVYKNGVLVAEAGKMQVSEPLETYPSEFYHSILCPEAEPSDFRLDCPEVAEETEVLCRVMKVHENTTRTSAELRKVRCTQGQLDYAAAGLCLIAVFNRYTTDKEIGYGLVETPFKNAAIATTWAHDHHNLMVMGSNAEDMCIAQRELVRMQGGMIVVSQGEIKARVALPMGGIVSNEPIENLGGAVAEIRRAMVQQGYRQENEIMSFCTLSLPVSPELKITDKGLIDVASQSIVSLLA